MLDLSDIMKALGDGCMTQEELIDLLEKQVGVIKSSVYKDRRKQAITDITYNSKACIKDSAFFVKGKNFKPEYVVDAVDNGASLVIAEKEYDTKEAGLIVVKDIRKAMVVVAEAFFDKAYEKGYFDKVITTNLTYTLPELLQRPYYLQADMSKFTASIIDFMNHDTSLTHTLTPTEKIHEIVRLSNARKADIEF